MNSFRSRERINLKLVAGYQHIHRNHLSVLRLYNFEMKQNESKTKLEKQIDSPLQTRTRKNHEIDHSKMK